jgi:hypothetical protein
VSAALALSSAPTPSAVAAVARGDTGDAAGRDGPGIHHDVFGRPGVLGLAGDLVELDAECVGDRGDGLPEHRRSLGRHGRQLGVVDRAADAGGPLGLGGVVEGRVGRLVDGDLVDPVADARGGDADQLDEAGADARPEHRRPAALAGPHDAIAVGARGTPVDERGRADDVDAGLEDAYDLVGVGPHRVVDDAVGLQREEEIDVIGGGDADRVDAAELTDVAADLAGGPGVAPDELEVAVGDDGADRPPADVARGPLEVGVTDDTGDHETVSGLVRLVNASATAG